MKFVLCALLFSAVCFAETPQFKPEYPFEHSAGDKWATDGKYINFTHADWDKDGDKDILGGYMFTAAGTEGHILYYENTGNDNAPVYKYKMKFPITVGGA